VARHARIENIIRYQGDMTGERVAGAQEPNDVVIKGVGLGIGADRLDLCFFFLREPISDSKVSGHKSADNRQQAIDAVLERSEDRQF